MVEVKIPSPGESITEVEIADWLVENGDYVEKDQEIAEIESDKATLPLVAEASGTIEILAQEGASIKVGEVACKIDASAGASEKAQAPTQAPAAETSSKKAGSTSGAATPGAKKKEQAQQTTGSSGEASKPDSDKPSQKPSEKSSEKSSEKPAAASTSEESSPSGQSGEPSSGGSSPSSRPEETSKRVKATPLARKMMEAHGVSVDQILQGLRRITKEDVNLALQGLTKEKAQQGQPSPGKEKTEPGTTSSGTTSSGTASPGTASPGTGSPGTGSSQASMSGDAKSSGPDSQTSESKGHKAGGVSSGPASPGPPSSEPNRQVHREKMSRLRRKLSERLVSVKNETAMLTTFNEVDMSEVMALRKRHQKAFQEKHGIKLGLMSFFIKASAQALQAYPNVNSMIEGDQVVYPQYADIGVAVQTPKGLMVPVIRNAENRSLADLEKQVKHFGEKGQKNRITIDEMEGGTFSITNGGVFGSLLSTPIINPPQSAILGMHTIQERPVAVEGQVEIRPMMYIALSYDHRTIDGKDSVSFLMKIKELVEKPQNLLIPGGNADKQLLGLA